MRFLSYGMEDVSACGSCPQVETPTRVVSSRRWPLARHMMRLIGDVIGERNTHIWAKC